VTALFIIVMKQLWTDCFLIIHHSLFITAAAVIYLAQPGAGVLALKSDLNSVNIRCIGETSDGYGIK
jgi:hypothetical protein